MVKKAGPSADDVIDHKDPSGHFKRPSDHSVNDRGRVPADEGAGAAGPDGGKPEAGAQEDGITHAAHPPAGSVGNYEAKTLREVKREEGFKLHHEDQTWTLDVSEWRDEKGAGELRVHFKEPHQDLPRLLEALQREADSRGLSLKNDWLIPEGGVVPDE